ncbi:MAG: hypothetical protein QXX57_05915, partial [Nitrososphaerota archaeon]
PGTTRTEVVTIVMTLPQTTTPIQTVTTPSPTTVQTPTGPSGAMWLGIAILAVLLVVAVALAAVVLRIRL